MLNWRSFRILSLNLRHFHLFLTCLQNLLVPHWTVHTTLGFNRFLWGIFRVFKINFPFFYLLKRWFNHRFADTSSNMIWLKVCKLRCFQVTWQCKLKARMSHCTRPSTGWLLGEASLFTERSDLNQSSKNKLKKYFQMNFFSFDYTGGLR